MGKDGWLIQAVLTAHQRPPSKLAERFAIGFLRSIAEASLAKSDGHDGPSSKKTK